MHTAPAGETHGFQHPLDGLGLISSSAFFITLDSSFPRSTSPYPRWSPIYDFGDGICDPSFLYRSYPTSDSDTA